MNNKDLEQMILQELVLQPILEFIVDKFAEELLKEDEEENGGFSNVDNLENQGQNTQQVSALSDGSGLKTPCVGSYPVSGYTRSDGTEVKPYTRTCGAKHLVQEKENEENEEDINYSENVFKQNKNMNITLKTGIKLDILQNKLIDINNEQNDKFNNAKECMNISIIGPENIEDNAEYNIISTTEIDKLSKILDSNIDKKLYTVLFSEKSSLTKNINSSWELIRQLQNNIIQLKNKESIPISFNKDENLFRTLHNATLIVEEYNNDTVMGYIYDKYDFKYQSLNIKNKMEMIASLSNMFMYSNPFYINNKVQNGLLHNDYINLVNDIATFLQNINVIKNYNIIVPIHIKL